MARRLFCGIDPGSTCGYLATIDNDGKFIGYWKLPNRKYISDVQNKSGRYKTHTLSNHQGIDRLLGKVTEGYDPSDVVVAIEFPTTIQGPFGAKATYPMAWSIAMCVSICYKRGFSVLLVPPKAWQGDAFPHRSGKHDKVKSVERVSNIFPQICDDLDDSPKADQEGKADSLNVALWGLKQFKPRKVKNVIKRSKTNSNDREQRTCERKNNRVATKRLSGAPGRNKRKSANKSGA